MDFSRLLNPEQLAAVMHEGGPMMIIAGAGSGKTRVITYRIAKLMLDGVDPFHILALTFTNKAAREMQERIAQIVGESEAKNLWMGTFHSVFARILRQEADKLGYGTDFTIYDQEDSRKLVRSIIRDMELDTDIYKPRQIASRISMAKNSLITPRVYANRPELMEQDVIAKRDKFLDIYIAYNERLFRANAMDFDDLLLKTNELLAKYPDVLMKYQRRFEHILVDEYQDTNHSQYLIVKSLSYYHRNITIVGDDAQSIYSFRGANIQNILNFKKDFPDATVYKLEQNYRSTKNIVGAGNSLIAHNRNRLEKKLWTENEEGEKITVFAAFNEAEEAAKIINEIARKHRQENIPLSDFAILYRTNAQSRPFEDALRNYNLPYRIYGNMSFYQRKEIKDVLAYLRLIVNEKDEEALNRVINWPARGIGEKTLQKVRILAHQYNRSLFEIIENIDRLPDTAIHRGTQKKLKDFALMIRNFQVLAEKTGVDELTRQVLKTTGLLEAYRKEYGPDADMRIENIEELINAMTEFVENQKELDDGDASLQAFLQQAALTTDLDSEDDNEDKLTLMTVHMSKGLEFPYVYIAGMEENLFPSMMTVMERESLEEERRLLYVAITRAKKKCTLSYAVSRRRWGNVYDTEPSRFLDEIDERYVERKDLKLLRHSVDPSIFDSPEPVTRPSRAGGISQTIRPKNLKPLRSGGGKGRAVIQLRPGDRVRHARFGDGEVIKVMDKGEDTKAVIKFDMTGTKTLILKFAKLEKIGG